MTSFNDGIEAAAKRLREISHEGLKASWWRERFESAARSVETLKRPEPSEADKVERLARWLFEEDQRGMFYPRKWDRLAEGPREWWRMKARAALKAMEQQGKEA